MLGESERVTAEYIPCQLPDQSNIGSGLVNAPYQQSEQQRQNHVSMQQPRFVHYINPHHTQHHNYVRTTSGSYSDLERSDVEYSSLNQCDAEEFPNHFPSHNYRDI